MRRYCTAGIRWSAVMVPSYWGTSTESKRTLVENSFSSAPLVLPQAGAAGAPVLRHAGPNGVGAVTADKSTVLVGDHRSELDSQHAMRTANHQRRISFRVGHSHTE